MRIEMQELLRRITEKTKALLVTYYRLAGKRGLQKEGLVYKILICGLSLIEVFLKIKEFSKYNYV